MGEDRSDVYVVSDCPIPDGTRNDHEGLDRLLDLMSENGGMAYENRPV